MSFVWKQVDSMENLNDMMEEFERDLTEEEKRKMQQAIWSELSFLRYVGAIVDLYVPKMINYITGTTPGVNPLNELPREETHSESSLAFGKSLETEEEE